MKLQQIQEVRLDVQHPVIKWINDEIFHLQTRREPFCKHRKKYVNRENIKPIHQALVSEFGQPRHETERKDPNDIWNKEWVWELNHNNGKSMEFALFLRYNDQESQILLELE